MKFCITFILMLVSSFNFAQSNFIKEWEGFKSPEWTIDYSINDSIHSSNQSIGELILINNRINFQVRFSVYNDLNLFTSLEETIEKSFLKAIHFPDRNIKTCFTHKQHYYILQFSLRLLHREELYRKLKDEIDKYINLK